MTINNRERIGWIDVAKGMAILAIVTIHTGFLPFSKITAPLLSWTLLIFPFIGGCLYKPNPSFIKFIIKKSRRLLLPYYIAGLISFIGWLFLRSHYPQNILLFPIADTALQLLLMQGSIFNGPLWFLPSYFICTSIVEMIYSYWEKRSNKTQLLLIIILTAFSLYLLSLQIIFPYALDISLLFVSFFLFGIYIKQSLFKLTSIKFIIFLVIFFTTSLINGTIDLNQRQLNIYPLFLISVCSGIAVIFYISKWIDKNNNIFIRPLSYLGEKSILLMIIHWPII